MNTNVEAAEEVARQIKIRDLSGLIVIDFIDMLNYHNRRIVERKIREKLKTDRARIQTGRISNFGLMEMTRQRLRESFIKWETNLSLESFGLKIIKKIEMLAFSKKTKIAMAYVPDKVAIYLNSELKKELSFFEKKYKFKINIMADNNLIIPQYRIHLLNKNKKIIEKIESVKNLKDLNGKKDNKIKTLPSANEKKKKQAVGRILWVRKKRRKSN